MQVARLYDFGDIRVEQDPRPAPGPDEILVRARACGICSGDIMPWYIRRKAPLVLGHEPVGVVEEVGAAVRGFRRGERVFVHHHAPCFECASCRRGEYVQCATWRATKIVPGGMAEYFVVGAHNQRDTLHLPDALGDADGVLIEPAACVVKSLRRAGLKRGESILIIGLGIMGMMHVVLARHLGAGRIIGADLFEARARRAVALGADAGLVVSGDNLVDQVREATAGAMADIVIVGPGSSKAIAQGIAAAGRGATVVQFTATPPEDEMIAEAARSLFQRDPAGAELFLRTRGHARGDGAGRAISTACRRPGDSSFPAGEGGRGVRDGAKARVAKGNRHVRRSVRPIANRYIRAAATLS